MGCIVRNSINAEPLAYIVEEDIAGLDDGLMKIHNTMTRSLTEDVTFELPAIKRSVRRTKRGEAGRRNFILKHCRRHDDFENRTGRELRLNRAIQQRLSRIIVELLPFLIRDPNREIIWVGRWMADHSQNVAAARIERDHRAIASAQRLLRDLL